VAKNIKKMGWKVLELTYDIIMIEDDGSYQSIYKHYLTIGTALG
jgi:hypothetical protein